MNTSKTNDAYMKYVTWIKMMYVIEAFSIIEFADISHPNEYMYKVCLNSCY